MNQKNGLIVELDNNEVIVVGTNLGGKHYGGAAAQACRDFGLEWGVGAGLSGQTYAFPTLDEKLNQLPIDRLRLAVVRLNETARLNPDKTFYLTKVGQGIAGYSEETMNDVLKTLEKNIIKV